MKIIIYKSKSMGLVLGEYSSPEEFVEAERRASSEFRTKINRKVYSILTGIDKSMYSVKYQSQITIRVKHERNKV